MTNTFDITAFGAVGDGVTDCPAAIQQAMDAAAECRGQVIIPPGEYATGKLHLHGHFVTMHGTSGWSYHGDGGSALKLNDPNADCLLDISGAVGCTVLGIGFNGGDLGERIHGIKLYYEKYNGNGQEDMLTVDDCRVAGFTGDGLHFEHVWAFTVRHCMMIFNKGAGLFIDGWDGFISDTIFCHNLNAGVLGGNTCSSLTFTGNRVEWNWRAGFDFSAGGSCNITGNFFDRSFGPAIDFRDYSMAAITGNVFRRSGAFNEDRPLQNGADSNCHIRLTGCSGVTVVGNTGRTGGDDGPGGEITPQTGFIIENCTECVIKDNALWQGAKQQLEDLRGDNSTCAIGGNIGSITV